MVLLTNRGEFLSEPSAANPVTQAGAEWQEATQLLLEELKPRYAKLVL